jgi:hypothetical protein
MTISGKRTVLNHYLTGISRLTGDPDKRPGMSLLTGQIILTRIIGRVLNLNPE